MCTILYQLKQDIQWRKKMEIYLNPVDYIQVNTTNWLVVVCAPPFICFSQPIGLPYPHLRKIVTYSKTSIKRQHNPFWHYISQKCGGFRSGHKKSRILFLNVTSVLVLQAFPQLFVAQCLGERSIECVGAVRLLGEGAACSLLATSSWALSGAKLRSCIINQQ